MAQDRRSECPDTVDGRPTRARQVTQDFADLVRRDAAVSFCGVVDVVEERAVVIAANRQPSVERAHWVEDVLTRVEDHRL